MTSGTAFSRAGRVMTAAPAVVVDLEHVVAEPKRLRWSAAVRATATLGLRPRPALGYKGCMPHRAFLVALVLAANSPAQDRHDPVAAARAALDAWLQSDHADTKLLEQAVHAIVAGGAGALDDLGRRARAAAASKDPHLGRGLDAAITHVTVAIFKRETGSGMTYAGQYDALRALQPFAGKLLLRLLIDTPDWFSQHDRHLLVFPLRDVFVDSPGEEVCQQLRVIATDEDFEPEPLRQNLAFALAQWGDRTLIEARIARVTKDADADGISDERRAALRYELADIHYTLRDYARAAQIHVEMLRQAEATHTSLLPLHYYNAACCLARAGAVDAALDELQRAAVLMRSGEIDPSQMLERKLFDRDPDLAKARESERFAKIVETAFGAKTEAADGGRERKDG